MQVCYSQDARRKNSKYFNWHFIWLLVNWLLHYFQIRQLLNWNPENGNISKTQMKTVIQSLQNTLENNDTNQQLKTKAIYFTKDIVYRPVVWSPPPPTPTIFWKAVTRKQLLLQIINTVIPIIIKHRKITEGFII